MKKLYKTAPRLPIRHFFLKRPLCLYKHRRFSIFIVINRNTYQFHAFELKKSSEMCQKMANLDLRTILMR